MGFSTIIAWLGVFLVLIVALVSLVSIYDAHLSDMEKFFEYEKEVNERYRTDYTISSAIYSPGRLDIVVLNSGRNQIKTTDVLGEKCLDIFVDGSYIKSGDYSLELANTTWNPLVWDPWEEMNIGVDCTLGSGTHSLVLVGCEGIKKTSSFSV